MMSSRFEVIVSPLAVLNHPNHGAKTFEYRVSGENSVCRYLGICRGIARSRSHYLCWSMRFSPVAWRHAFPVSERTSKGVWIFKSQKVSRFV